MYFDIVSSIAFSICVFIVLSFIVFVYIIKRKKRYKRSSSNYFLLLIISTLLTSVSEFAYVYYMVVYGLNYGISNIICKFNLFLIMLSLLFGWFYVISYRLEDVDDKMRKKRIKSISFGVLFFVWLILLLLVFIFPITQFYRDGIYSFKGVGVILIFSVISDITIIALLLINNKKLSFKDRIPIVVSMIIIAVVNVVQLIFGLDLNVEVFLLMIFILGIYFTVENQDYQLVLQAKEKQEEANNSHLAQMNIIANISLEIRTSMNIIIGYSQFLLKDENPTFEHFQNDIKNVHDAATSLLELIHNILDYSQLDSGEDALKEKEYSLEKLILEVQRVISIKLPSDIQFEIKLDENIPKMFFGDSTKISKILIHILNNAIYYTKYGKIVLDIHGKKDNKIFQFEFTIIHSGHAMTQEIFDKDFIESNDLGHDNMISSIMLGVMIAKRLTKLMDGNIEFLNETGKGTQYFIHLNQLIVDSSPVGNVFHNYSNTMKNNSFLDLSKRRFLIVDNNLTIDRLLLSFLDSYKVQIDTCSDGKTCLEKIKENSYDFIFLDYMMKSDGEEKVIQFIQKYGLHLPPVVALIDQSFDLQKEQYLKEGFADILSKPYKKQELEDLLYHFFGTSPTEREQKEGDTNG